MHSKCAKSFEASNTKSTTVTKSLGPWKKKPPHPNAAIISAKLLIELINILVDTIKTE
jgi:hypothetical protein